MKQMLICAFIFHSFNTVSMEHDPSSLSAQELALCKQIYQCNKNTQSRQTLVLPEIEKSTLVTALHKHKKQLFIEKETIPGRQMNLCIQYTNQIRCGRLCAITAFGLIGKEIIDPSPYIMYSCIGALILAGYANYNFKESTKTWHRYHALPNTLKSDQEINNKLLELLQNDSSPEALIH